MVEQDGGSRGGLFCERIRQNNVNFEGRGNPSRVSSRPCA
jgi:hypothetical protein